MRKYGRCRRPHRGDDAGVALVVVMQFMLVASALASLVAVASVHALRSATQDGASSAAQSTTDAGVAEAINYVRENGLQALTCSEPVTPTNSTWQSAASCTTPGWADPASPVTVAAGSVTSTSTCPAQADCYRVWIGTLQAYASAKGAPGTPGAAATQPAILRIHSLGVSGVGPAARSVVVEVKVAPTRFPFGVFGNTFSMPASHSPAASESLFTTGNVSLKCPLSGVDYQNNIPAAVHAAGTLSYSNGSCHPPANGTASCHTSVPYDQDSHGVSFTGSNAACNNYDLTDPNFSGAGVTAYSQGSYFDSKGLAAYGYRPGGLSPAEYDKLEAEAQAEGTYNNVTNLGAVLTQLVANGVTNPVVYNDDGQSPTPAQFPNGFFRSPTATNCPLYAATIIIRGANSVHWTATGGSNFVASVFMPDTGSTYSATGQAGLLGTLFADNIAFNGNAFVQLDPCFVANPPGGVLDITTTNFRNVDTGNVQ